MKGLLYKIKKKHISRAEMESVMYPDTIIRLLKKDTQILYKYCNTVSTIL